MPDALGARLIRDREESRQKRMRADRLEREARILRRQTDEIDRLAELARFER